MSSELDAHTGTEQQLHEKDVVITAYSRGTFGSPRDFVAAVFGDYTDKDPLDTYETRNRTVKLEVEITGEYTYDSGRTIERTVSEYIKPFNSRDKEVFANEVRDMDLPAGFTLVDETEVSVEDSHTVGTIVEDGLLWMVSPIDLSPFGFEGGLDSYVYAGSWEREIPDKSVDAQAGDTITQYVRVEAPNGNYIEPRRVLTHQAERTPDNRFESDETYWSLQVTVHIEATSESELDDISEQTVLPVYQGLAKLDGIDAVRLSECEECVTRQGSCYAL